MLEGVADTRIELILLEMGLQLTTLPTIFFLTMNAPHTDISSTLQKTRSCTHPLLMFHRCQFF